MNLIKRNRKIAGLITLICLIAGPLTASAGTVFPDVVDRSEHSAAIEYLKSSGIIGGYPDGSFKPEKTINRAEALKIVFLAKKALSGDAAVNLQSINFPDVKSSDWFYPYVQRAFSLKIVEGYSDGSFKPANEITAAESLKIIYKSLIPNYSEETVTMLPYVDVQVDTWYAPYVDYGRKRQLIEGRDDGTYLPERKMSRAEFAEAIYRTMYVEQNKLDKFPLNQNWNTCNNYTLGYKLKYPFSWQKIPAGEQMIFWKQDTANGQTSFARVYPNSAVVIVARDENTQGLGLEQYLSQLEYGQGASKQVITLNGLPYASIFIEQSGLQDSYFQMPDKSIVIVYGQVGEGSLASQLKEEIRYMIGSLRNSGAAENGSENCLGQPAASGTVTSDSGSGGNDDLKALLLSWVLVDGKATEALEKVSDEVLFETDSLGIGTGPVDYYYSVQLGLTMKI
ncbi:S-layer homology domain-containing protein, partial [Candidatus Peregrinibacteria bacterium]|nr:S-layer homology domain-containing protein [Candidatus Peregrinibacteria bacterium]